MVVELGGRPLPQETVVGMVGEGAAVLVRRALAAAELPDSPDALGRLPRDLRRASPASHRGVSRRARRRGSRPALGARVAVLTNKPLRHTERLLDGLGDPAALRRRGGRRRPASPEAVARRPARADGGRRCQPDDYVDGGGLAGGLRDRAERRHRNAASSRGDSASRGFRQARCRPRRGSRTTPPPWPHTSSASRAPNCEL